MMNKHVESQRPDAIAIVGATASGKTATSLELSFLLGLHNDFAFPVEIISADSRQIYRYLTIGTAKPSREDLETVPHHFIDCKNPDERCSAGDFGTEAAETVLTIRQRGKLPVIVGGAGLYVQALCDGFFEEASEVNDDAAYNEIIEKERFALQAEFETQGIVQLFAELEKVDPASAKKYTDMNPRRIIRALEYYRATGVALSEAHTTSHVGRSFKTRFFGVHVEREELYARINARAAAMFTDGLLEEMASVLALGYSPDLNSLNTVGYKEARSHLRGEITLERAVELTQQNTRRYAKRQMTWFRRDNRIEWLSGTPEEIAHSIITRLRRG